jgi:hypothetical protein
MEVPMKARFALLMMISFAAPVTAQQVVTVDFSTATLTVTDGDHVLLRTQVVLPRGDYYTVVRFVR